MRKTIPPSNGENLLNIILAKRLFIVLMVAFFMSFTIPSAIAENDTNSAKRMLFAYLFGEYIQKCQSKEKFSDSNSKNIRKAAALAALKVEYLNANKNKLIGDMLKAELSLKKYKVHYFLNTRFFNYYASQSNLQQKVADAATEYQTSYSSVFPYHIPNF